MKISFLYTTNKTQKMRADGQNHDDHLPREKPQTITEG